MINETVGFVKTIRMSGNYHDDADIKPPPPKVVESAPKQRPVSEENNELIVRKSSVD